MSICQPDEVNALREATDQPPRRLMASADAATPLYATTPGSRLTKRGGRVVLIEDGKEVATRRLIDVAHIGVFGNVTVGSALLRACFKQGVPVLWFSSGGWFSGVATGMPPKNVEVRMRQHRGAALGSVEIARSMVAGKVRNARTLLRRHGGEGVKRPVEQLAELARTAERTERLDALLGVEGTAARMYFGNFGSLLHRRQDADGFRFEERNRRAPRDPVNALLSLAYALLVKDATVALLSCGLDPYVGLYHGRASGGPRSPSTWPRSSAPSWVTPPS